MGKTIILTKNHPSELGDIEKAEAYQISLEGGATGEQVLQEQHGWWNEREQKAEALAPTLRTEKIPYEQAHDEYIRQIAARALQGFWHSRSYSFTEGKFIYRDLRQALPAKGAATMADQIKTGVNGPTYRVEEDGRVFVVDQKGDVLNVPVPEDVAEQVRAAVKRGKDFKPKGN